MQLGTHFPLRVLDWFVAGIMFTWGATCLNVADATWQLSIYDGLRAWAGQNFWGFIMLGLGAVRLAALYVNGALRRTPHTRMVGAFLCAFIWLQLGFAMLQSETPPIAGLTIYPWLFLADIYNVYRAAQDAKVSDWRHSTPSERVTGTSEDAHNASA